MKMQAATLRAAPVIVVSVKSAGIFRKKSIILRPLMVLHGGRGACASAAVPRARAGSPGGFRWILFRRSACTPTQAEQGSA